jgi:hypothetical protein
VALAPETTAPVNDWAYQYQLPADFLRSITVGDLGAEAEFKIEGRKLLCDDNPCYLRYVFANDNPATYDAMLVDLMTVTMAHRMAYAITQSAALVEQMAVQVRMLTKQAKAADGQDDTPDYLGDNPILSAGYIGARA